MTPTFQNGQLGEISELMQNDMPLQHATARLHKSHRDDTVSAVNRTSGLGVILWWKAGCMAPVTTVGVPRDSWFSMSEVRLVTRTNTGPNQTGFQNLSKKSSVRVRNILTDTSLHFDLRWLLSSSWSHCFPIWLCSPAAAQSTCTMVRYRKLPANLYSNCCYFTKQPYYFFWACRSPTFSDGRPGLLCGGLWASLATRAVSQ